MEPRQDLRKFLKKRGVPLQDFVTLNHGETLTLEEPDDNTVEPVIPGVVPTAPAVDLDDISNTV